MKQITIETNFNKDAFKKNSLMNILEEKKSSGNVIQDVRNYGETNFKDVMEFRAGQSKKYETPVIQTHIVRQNGEKIVGFVLKASNSPKW